MGRLHWRVQRWSSSPTRIGSRRTERVQVSVYRAHSEQAVVAHACHGHRYRPSPVLLSGAGDKRREGVRGGGGTACTGIGSRRRVILGVMEFGMSHRIKPKRNMCTFQ